MSDEQPRAAIRGVLLDLSGTLHLEEELLTGAQEAVTRLREAGLPVRFLTNTSRTSRAGLRRRLARFGLELPEEEILTAPLALIRVLRRERRRPFLLVHPDLEEEFAGLPREDPDAVVVTYAAEGFTYPALNEAFRLLRRGAPLLATGRTRYFQGKDGLMLDAGPFVAALEYAARTEARVFGKPAAEFFLAAVEEFGCQPEEAVMIGDDGESDVGGALAAGLQGILVRTGKYRPGDEDLPGGRRAETARDVGEAVDRILKNIVC